MVYHRATTSFEFFGIIRSPSFGIGNLLLPITRSLIASKKDGIFIYPTIPQLKIGTFLRNEVDKRMYTNVFRNRNFTEWKEYINSYLVKQVPEESYRFDKKNIKTGCIIYSDMGNYFHDIHNEKELILNWILDSSKKNLKKLLHENSNGSPLSVHIRLGDFSTNHSENGETTYQLSKNWYQQSIRYVLENYKLNGSEVTIYSDTSTKYIKDWLGNDEYNYKGADILSPMESIMEASKSRFFIGSRSTFSMWIAFLSNGLCFWDKNFNLNKFFPERINIDLKI